MIRFYSSGIKTWAHLIFEDEKVTCSQHKILFLNGESGSVTRWPTEGVALWVVYSVNVARLGLFIVTQSENHTAKSVPGKIN